MIKNKSKNILSRLEFASKLLSNLNGDNVIDLGCREQELKLSLKGNYNYYGVDLNKDTEKKSYLITYNLENGFPNLNISTDITVCLDVLEHLDNAHQLRDQILSHTKKKIVIALPNMAYYKFRLKFLTTGELSGKYPFGREKPLDRHKWISNIRSADEFMSVVDPDIWHMKKNQFYCTKKKKFYSVLFRKIFIKIISKSFCL